MIEEITNNKYIRNGQILIVFIYLKYILSLILLGNSNLAEQATIIATIVLVGIYIYVNKFKFNYKGILIIAIITILYLLNIIIVPYKDLVVKQYIQFLSYNLIIIFTISSGINYKETLKTWYYIARVTLVITALMIILGLEGDMNYMFIGIYNAYTSLIIGYYLMTTEKHRIKNTILISISIIIAFQGNRSAMITIAVGLAFSYFMLYKKNTLKGFLSKVMIIVIVLLSLLNISEILNFIIDTFNKLNIDSYAIRKLNMMIHQGLLASSSGRGELYEVAVNIITEANGLPRGVGYFQYITGIQYPHNFLLEVWVVFGYIMGSVFLVLYLIGIIRLYKKIKFDSPQGILFSLVLIYFATRTLVSSSFLVERSFFVVLSMIIINKKESIRWVENFNEK